jgi:hypothetical protein
VAERQRRDGDVVARARGLAELRPSVGERQRRDGDGRELDLSRELKSSSKADRGTPIASPSLAWRADPSAF